MGGKNTVNEKFEELKEKIIEKGSPRYGVSINHEKVGIKVESGWKANIGDIDEINVAEKIIKKK